VSVSPTEICVAHLVRRANGIGAFRSFLESYRRNPAGVAHELLLIFKGFAHYAQLAPFEALLDGLPHGRIFVRDFGYDVRPYVKVAREQPYQYFVFLNSFSRILAAGWLEMLFRHARRPGVGIVGATASYQSLASDYHAFKRARRPDLPTYVQPALPLYRYIRYAVAIRGHFAEFPNHHVRTNAFMITRDVMIGMRTETLLRKWDALSFESSRQGMTPQIMAAGLQALVVGADGRGYEPPDWPHARTFWISQQENLLVSDNRTRAYEEGPPALREHLAFRAWRRYPDGRVRTDVPQLCGGLPGARDVPGAESSA
jgi:hypothetical protein